MEDDDDSGKKEKKKSGKKKWSEICTQLTNAIQTRVFLYILVIVRDIDSQSSGWNLFLQAARSLPRENL